MYKSHPLTTMFLAGCVMLIGATGCSTNSQEAPGSVPSAVQTESTQPVEPESAPPAVEGGGASEETTQPLPDDESPSEDTSEEAEDPLYKFGDTVTYQSGLQVTVSKPKAFKPSEYAALPDGNFKSFVRVTITVKNTAATRYDPSEFTSSGSSGDKESGEVYDGEIGGSPDTKVLKGKSKSWDIGYGVVKGQDFVLEIRPDFDTEEAIFTS